MASPPVTKLGSRPVLLQSAGRTPADPALAFGALNFVRGPSCSHRVNHSLLSQREPQGEGLQTILQKRKKRNAARLRTRQYPLAYALGSVPLFYLKSACGGSPTGGEQLALSWPGIGRVGPVNFLPVILIIGGVSSRDWKVTDNISEFNEIVRFCRQVRMCIRNRRLAQRGPARGPGHAGERCGLPLNPRPLPRQSADAPALSSCWSGPGQTCRGKNDRPGATDRWRAPARPNP